MRKVSVAAIPAGGDSQQSGKLQIVIAGLATTCITAHLLLRCVPECSLVVGEGVGREIRLIIALPFGGSHLVFELLRSLFKAELGTDHLAGISIVTSEICSF